MHIKFYFCKEVVFRLITFFIISLTISLSCLALSQSKNSSDNLTKGIRLPIVMYHFISKNEENKNKFTISKQAFENDLIYIKEHGYNTILVKDLIEYTEGKSELPEKPILLTFDDGCYNNYIYAFPLSKKYNSKFVFSPIVKETQKYSTIEDKNPSYAHANWNELAEMVKSGLVEIQNHTYDMHQNKQGRLGCTKKINESNDIYKEKLTNDLKKAQDMINENIGFLPSAFFYPFGAKSKESEEIIKSMGFKATFLCENKVNFINKSPESLFGLKRFLRPPKMSSEKFFSILEK